jgi:NAD(P)-dependent dehydrogenase (short-subunit alcohol dehydrogenase family)
VASITVACYAYKHEAAYSAAKAAVISMTRSDAIDVSYISFARLEMTS